MNRERLALSGSLLAWTEGHIRNNVWRTRPFADEHDLLQEAYLVLLRCRDRYPQTGGAHFGTLFRVAFRNRVIDLASKYRWRRERGEMPDVVEDRKAQHDFNVVDYNDLLENAPVAIKPLLLRLGLRPIRADRVRLARAGGFLIRKLRDTENDVLCRALKIPSDSIDLSRIIRQWVLGETEHAS